MTLDFEKTVGLSGWIKKKGELATQKIDTYLSRFAMSSGATGTTARSPMAEGTPFSARVSQGGSASGVLLLAVMAKLSTAGQRAQL